MIRRREVITLLGGAAAAWPLPTRAQQPAMPVIGFLSSRSLAVDAQLVTAFRQGLNEGGFVEGRNVAIEYGWAEGQYDRLPALAAAFVAKPVAVLVSTGGTVSARAAKAATKTIPVVFTTGDDPVKVGLVESLNRPGGNVTGITTSFVEAVSKRVGLLHELMPKASEIALLVNPSSNAADPETAEVQAAAGVIGQHVEVLKAVTDRDIDAGICEPGTQTDRRAAHFGRPVFLHARPSARGVSGTPGRSDVVFSARIRRRRRADGVRVELCRILSGGGRLRRPDSQRGETGRPPGSAADQVRAGDQLEDGQGARPDGA